MNSSSNDLTDHSISWEFTWRNISLIGLALLTCLLTVVANVLLIILVCVDAKLRRFSNYYIVSLACADLILGVFVMPLHSLYSILGYWPFGALVCEIWTTSDFVCASASIFGICMISLDRYWAITQPLKHLRRQGRRKSLGFVAAVWITSTICWVPSMVAHRIILGSFLQDSLCLFLPSFPFVFASSMFIYVIPMTAMVILYGRIVWVVKKSWMKIHHDQTDRADGGNHVSFKMRICCCIGYPLRSGKSLADIIRRRIQISTVSYGVDSSLSNMHSPTSTSFTDIMSPVTRSPVQPIVLNPMESLRGDHCVGEDNVNVQAQSRREIDYALRESPSIASQDQDVPEQDDSRNNDLQRNDSFERRNKRRCDQDRVTSRMRLHQRTARILGIIVSVFLVCWVPFVVLFPVNSYCNCVPTWLYNASYWMAYLNSTLNPFLYGFSGDFREAFRRLVLKRCKRTKDT